MPTTEVTPEHGEVLQEVANVLGKSRKVVVITGAGISTNCGIPDFRSENGLYALIQAQYDAAANASSQEFPEERPSKRRKVERSSSGFDSQTGSLQEPSPRRQLRSSQSFIATTSEVEEIRVCAEGEPSTQHKTITQLQRRHSSFVTTTTKSTLTLETTEEICSQASTSSSSSRQSLPNLKGKDLFDSIIWKDSFTTSIFYTFISSLRQKIRNDVKDTTQTHKFIKTLRDGGRLVRNYTQNIDMLETREGLCADLERGVGNRSRFSHKIQREARPELINEGSEHDSGVEVVHLHGSLDVLRCGLCAKLSSWEEDEMEATLAGEAPDCPSCSAANAKREGKGRRSLAVGRLRPDIVLYGEEHPSAHLVAPLITHDLSLGPDVLLILGTSLRVHGLKVMVREFAKAVHGRGGKVVFVNQTKPPDSIWGDIIDYWVNWDCDAWVEDLKVRREDIWLRQGSQTAEKDKEVKPKVPPKNPASMRTDTTNGAYFYCKIMGNLERITGQTHPSRVRRLAKLETDHRLCTAAGGLPRLLTSPGVSHLASLEPLNSEYAISEFEQRLCDAQLLAQLQSTPCQQGSKRKQPARPMSMRPDIHNGATCVLSILGNLKRIFAGESPLPKSIKTQTLKDKRVVLGAVSTNIPGKRIRRPTAKQAMNMMEYSQLPTPPSSDQATPQPTPQPTTPNEELRIKHLSSISNILSSSPPPNDNASRVWRDQAFGLMFPREPDYAFDFKNYKKICSSTFTRSF